MIDMCLLTSTWEDDSKIQGVPHRSGVTFHRKPNLMFPYLLPLPAITLYPFCIFFDCTFFSPMECFWEQEFIILFVVVVICFTSLALSLAVILVEWMDEWTAFYVKERFFNILDIVIPESILLDREQTFPGQPSFDNCLGVLSLLTYH